MSVVSIQPVNENTNTVMVKNRLLIGNLVKFYENDENLARVVPIIEKKSNLSLRLIEWFITKHALANNVVIESIGNVHMCYKKTLKSYNKRRFDPFRRNERIYMTFERKHKPIKVESTVAQLNFFMWLIRTKILDHIVDNITELTKLAPKGGTARSKAPAAKPPKNMQVSREVTDTHVSMYVVFE